MPFKPFYIYRNNPRRHTDSGAVKRMPRGFTAKIEPSQEKHKVLVSISFCSYKDEFVKKKGREIVDLLPGQLVNARDVAKVLSDAQDRCGWSGGEYFFLYVLKFML